MNKHLWIPAMVAIALLSGCGRTVSVKVPPAPTATMKDTVDHDFTATISKTSDPSIFLLRVENINLNADKQIGGMALTVAFVVTDSSGKELHYDRQNEYEYADPLGKVFKDVPVKQARCVRGEVKLETKHLKPGTYTIEPKVRIFEAGKDAVKGHLYTDGGSVAVPAGNKLAVTIP